MASLEELFGSAQGGPGLSPELEQSIAQVNSNIAGLLQRSSQGPSVGDLGRSLLMSAGYGGQVPYTKFLQDDMAQQYQMVGQQAQLVSQSTELYMKAAESKAQGNPLAAYIANTYKELLQEDPYKADQWVQAMINDPEPASMDMVSRHLQAVRPRGKLTKIEQDVGDQTVSAFQDEEGNIVASPLTGEELTTAPRYKPETNVTTEVKIPAQYPPAPTGYHYTELPEPGKPIKLAKTEGGPPENSTESGRLAALDIAKQDIALAKSIMLPEGNKDTTATLTGDWNVPFTEGRRARTAIRRSLDTLAKYKTGAAMSESEAEGYLQTYMPSPGDSNAEAQDKFLRFEQFIQQSFERSGTEPNLGNENQLPSAADVDNMSEEEVNEWLNKLK
jgi:hypothetical protein